MYPHSLLVTSVRGIGLLPITDASVELTVIGFMKAAFGLRLAPDFFFGAALLVAAFFIGFLAAGLRAAGHLDMRYRRIRSEFQRLAEVLLARLLVRSIGEPAQERAHLVDDFRMVGAHRDMRVGVPRLELESRVQSVADLAPVALRERL